MVLRCTQPSGGELNSSLSWSLWKGTTVVFVLTWALGAGTYVLFSGQFSADELLAAGLWGLIAAAWSASLRRAATLQFRFEQGAAAAAGRAVAGLPRATAGTGLVLARALTGVANASDAPGEVILEAFPPGHRHCPADAGRRAIAILARSLGPDSFVMRIPEEREEVDVHQLVKTSAVEDARWAI